MRQFLASLFIVLPAFAHADGPFVVTSIKPVFDLVQTVMTGVGEPELLLSQNESVHHAILRPSRLRSLLAADLLVSVGQHMEPWLEKGIEFQKPNAQWLVLADLADVRLLDIRQPATLASDEEQAQAVLEKPEEPKVEEDADFFQTEDNSLESDLEDTANAAADDADAKILAEISGEPLEPAVDVREHGSGRDPHVWLDPRNSALFLDAIAEVLIEIDPDHADQYQTNAQEAKLALAEAVLSVKDRLVYLTDSRFIYNHDSFQYFEKAFGLKSIGFLSTSDAKQVGARTISGITAKIEFAPVICLIIDESESSRSARNLFPDIETVSLDPLGRGLEPSDSYPASLFLGLSDGFAECD